MSPRCVQDAQGTGAPTLTVKGAFLYNYLPRSFKKSSILNLPGTYTHVFSNHSVIFVSVTDNGGLQLRVCLCQASNINIRGHADKVT